nr:MobF family relaxase [Nocardioides ginsengisegetis]
MRKMSAGSGYRYLLRSVVAGDGNRGLATPLTRYYAEAGTPPGRWLGSGLSGLGDGQLKPGAQVHESQLALLIGLGRDPVTGEQLGRAFPDYPATDTRIAARAAEIPDDVRGEERDAEVARIEAEESAASGRRPVAGFDFTFSVPKSVSVLWAVADADLQAMIVEAHHAAVAEVLDYFEREVAATRTGFANTDGAVAQVGVAGVVAAAFDHYDSRAGDPQLHTHVVIANKVQALLDGRWRSLDSRPVHAAVTALSAHYNAVLADRLTGTFGVGWEARDRGVDRNLQWEIAGVPEGLIGEFSSRTREIEKEKDRLIGEYAERHGRAPSNATIVQLRAQATLATRPEKEIRSLADLTREWRQRTDTIIGGDPARWARAVASGAAPGVVEVDAIPLDRIHEVARQVVAEVSTQRSTWRHWNLWASASRQTMGWRFRNAGDREKVVGLIVEAAEAASVALTPPELALSPAAFRRDDGTSVFRPRHATIYSSTEILALEDRLLARAAEPTGKQAAPRLELESVTAATRRSVARGRLSRDQAEAIARVAATGRRLDLLVGPAGTGKTTAMRALARAWVRTYGRGSVIGLAPSAAAAQALADDLGIECDNTAKWLHDHDRGRVGFATGQLVIIDEASLADTRTLDRITGLAVNAGAKVLLVGDDAQLQSVDAGGAFSMLVEARGSDVPVLREIHRFTHAWEKHATTALRRGEVEVIDTYANHGRLRDGTTDQMLDAAYTAWCADVRRGLDSILVTDATSSVLALNARARADRILTYDDACGPEVELAKGAHASAGDLVITRKNDRRLRALNGGWVRNGDRWTVTAVRKDGSLAVRRTWHRLSATVVLPPEYVAQHVELGYAVTAHRAQGITVDTAHVVASASTTRENLYVSMTRGRDSNIAYVALDRPDDTHPTADVEGGNAGTVIFGVLQHSGAELSAHQIMQIEQETWTSIAQLAAEYETVASAAQRDRLVDLLRRSGLTPKQLRAAASSTAFGPLTAALRQAEAHHHNLEQLLPRVVTQHPLDDADDMAAVIRYRVDTAASPSSPDPASPPPRLIAGLIPEALGPMEGEHRHALEQRRLLIALRARLLADGGRGLGIDPLDAVEWGLWRAALTTVAAYRDRYVIATTGPLGGTAGRDAQRRARLPTRKADRLPGRTGTPGSSHETQANAAPAAGLE